MPNRFSFARTRRPPADPVSICLAGACAVHCLVTPMAAAALPVAGLTLDNPFVEWSLILLSAGTSAYVLARGCVRSHGQWRGLLPFVAGVGVLLAGRSVEESHPVVAAAAVAVGATGIISAHALNMRWCRRAAATHCGHLPPATHTACAAHTS